MDSSFTEVMPYIFQEEVGYVDNPKDPGGATNMGITIGTLSGWLGRSVTKQDVKALSKGVATNIYRQQYWDKIRGDDLPSGIDYAVFDFAVNSGPARAITMLQQILRVQESGVIDAKTRTAIAEHSIQDLINAISDKRAQWLEGLASAATFGPGWLARVRRVRIRALALAAKQAEAPVPPPMLSEAPVNFPQPANTASAEVPKQPTTVIASIQHPARSATLITIIISLATIFLEDGFWETGLAILAILFSIGNYFYFTKWWKKKNASPPA